MIDTKEMIEKWKQREIESTKDFLRRNLEFFSKQKLGVADKYLARKIAEEGIARGAIGSDIFPVLKLGCRNYGIEY